jgi:hypothetical protein
VRSGRSRRGIAVVHHQGLAVEALGWAFGVRAGADAERKPKSNARR